MKCICIDEAEALNYQGSTGLFEPGQICKRLRIYEMKLTDRLYCVKDETVLMLKDCEVPWASYYKPQFDKAFRIIEK